MRDIRIRQKKFFGYHFHDCRMPERWTELTASQFVDVARLYHGTIDADELFRRLLSLPRWCRQMDEFYQYMIAEGLAFVAEPKEAVDFFFMPRLPGTKMFAPGRRLSGMTLEQFMHADTHFSRYVATEKESELDLFVTMLYLRKCDCFVLLNEGNNRLFYGKERKLLNPSQRVKDIQDVDVNIKYAVLLNFILIKVWLSRSFPHLFPPSDEDEQPKGKEKKVEPTKWLDIFDNFVGDDIPQMDHYRAMPVTTAFRIMNKRIRESKLKKK